MFTLRNKEGYDFISSLFFSTYADINKIIKTNGQDRSFLYYFGFSYIVDNKFLFDIKIEYNEFESTNCIAYLLYKFCQQRVTIKNKICTSLIVFDTVLFFIFFFFASKN